MRYISTRGRMVAARFSDVLLEGLAPDGGLAVPASYPKADAATLARWRTLDYAALASEILALYCDDINRAALEQLTRAVYTRERFGTDAITPVAPLADGLSLLRLSNGPTLAFKDIAMQLLGALFEFVLERRGARLNVLGATSGDTGSAAEYALRGRRGVQVFMLSPRGRMSAFQRAQMFSLNDANIFNLAIEGVFDDCQDIVKSIAGDLEFKRRFHLGAVNSINWARIVAQVVYYFKGYFAATHSEDEHVSFAVPSGNFGNILAGWIAKQMGLPIARLVLATNENNVLDEFFRTGRYRVRTAAQTHATSSPSMDISKASNFERFVFDIVGRDADIVRELWWQFDSCGEFDLSATPWWPRVAESGFVSGTSTHADRLATIRDVYAKTGTVIDPHTADGVKVARAYVEPGVPMLCLETALPIKFADTIVEALGIAPERPAALRDLETLPQRVTVLPADAARVREFLAAHDG
jgi:threonine synthase